jgi:MFS family permease
MASKNDMTDEASEPPPISDQERIKGLRWSLAQAMLNSVFALWTFGGSVFVLFLAELGLPKVQIGMLLSFFPFCGVLALGFAPVAARLGRKRVFLICYGGRKPVMALLLLLPWVVSRYGQETAVIFLSVVIIVFAILRALAETALYPWSQEYVPNHVRGKFAAWSAVLGLIAAGAALYIAGQVIASGTGLGRYLFLIGAGSVIGFIGVLVMIKVPGGAPFRQALTIKQHLGNMTEALRDRNFCAYLGGMAGLTIGTVMMVSFLPLYLREQMGLAAANVVRLDIVAMVGGALASLGWGWLSDRVGSRPVLMPAAAMRMLLPLAWLLLPRHLEQPLLWCALLYFAIGVANNGVAIGAGRLLFNGVIPPEKNTAYTALHYAWMGVTGGVAPLLAGGILTLAADRRMVVLGLTVDGYAVMFTTGLVLLLTGWLLYGRVRPDDVHTTRTVLRSFMNRITQR